MILLVTPKIGTQVSWWLKAIGCKKDVTHEQEEEWFIEKERKVTEVANPLLITGLAELVTALGLGFLSDSKDLKFFSFLLGAKGIILNIIGGIHTYDLVSNVRSKQRQKEVPKIKTKLETSERSSGLSGGEIGKIIEGGETVQNLTNDQTPIKESLKELQELEERFDIEKVLSIVKKILNKCPKKEYKDIANEVYDELAEIGKKINVKVLSKALEDNNVRLKRWAMLCLIAKETEDADRVLIDAVKKPENLAIVLSFTTNENLEPLVSRITEIVKKAAA